MKVMILLAAISAATALASSAMAQQTNAPESVAAASGPATAPVATGVVTPTSVAASPAVAPAETPAGPPASAASELKGHIYFFRPARLSGAFYTYHVREVGEDGKVLESSPLLGRLPSNGYFVADVEPGIHNFNLSGPMAINKDSDRIRLEVEPGETYYVSQQERMGLVTSGFRLVPATAERFQQIQPHLHDTATTAVTPAAATEAAKEDQH